MAWIIKIKISTIRYSATLPILIPCNSIFLNLIKPALPGMGCRLMEPVRRIKNCINQSSMNIEEEGLGQWELNKSLSGRPEGNKFQMLKVDYLKNLGL